MNRHVKVVVFLAAIVLIAVLILNIKKESEYGKVPEVEKLAAREFLGVKVLDIFLGVLGLAFVGVAVVYVSSLVKGRKEPVAVAEAAEATADVPVAEAPLKKKLALEKVLGRTGTKILSIVIVVLIILVVLAILVLLFADKLSERFPFLQKVLESFD